MPGSDAESSQRSSFQTVKNGSTPSIPHSVSLTRDHITEALAKSPDNGTTLDLTHKGLSDVGESGAEELSMVGQSEDSDEMESTVVRYAHLIQLLVQRTHAQNQDCPGVQPSHDLTHGVLTPITLALPRLEKQQLLCVPGRGEFVAMLSRLALT